MSTCRNFIFCQVERKNLRNVQTVSLVDIYIYIYIYIYININEEFDYLKVYMQKFCSLVENWYIYGCGNFAIEMAYLNIIIAPVNNYVFREHIRATLSCPSINSYWRQKILSAMRQCCMLCIMSAKRNATE